jgi:peptidoglycan L-alanyl-D-glutamate endopeptidase CwlK
MPKFSQRSLRRLNECHPLLKRLMLSVIQEIDISILCGFRGEKEQNEAFERGTSKLRWPQSKHNVSPSMAVDAVPYPIDWNDELRFREMGRVVKEHWERIPAEEREGWTLGWGGDWRTFKDFPHFQIDRRRA